MNSSFVDVITSITSWAGSAGWIGVAAFALAFVCATLVFVPASPLTAVAGFLFGPVWGTLLVSPLGVLVAYVAFLIGRTAGRPWVVSKVSKRPSLIALDTAIGGNGFRIVFLLRLASVLPFVPLSYGLGASKVHQRDYLLASWLGLLPGTILYVYLGSLVGSVADLVAGGQDPEFTLHLAGLTMAAIAIAVLARITRKALQGAIEQEARRNSAESPALSKEP